MKTNATRSGGAVQAPDLSFLGFAASEEPRAVEEVVGEISAGGEGDADAREALAFDVMESAALVADLRREFKLRRLLPGPGAHFADLAVALADERARLEATARDLGCDVEIPAPPEAVAEVLGAGVVPTAGIVLDPDATVGDLADRHSRAELERMGEALAQEVAAVDAALDSPLLKGDDRAALDALEEQFEAYRCALDATAQALARAAGGDAVVRALSAIAKAARAPRKVLSSVGLTVALPDRFHETQNGHRPASDANLALACQRPDIIGCTIGFDTFRDELMLSNDGGASWAPFCDEHYTQIKLRLTNEHRFQKVATDALREHVYAAGKHNSFDSARLWLEGLPPWDGVPRIDAFCPRYLGAEDREYTRAVGAYMWTALAGRVMEPGIKADMVPVLVGRQGARKSSSIAAISPSPDFFDELAFDVRDADLSRKLKGLLVGELAELRGLATRELEAIKNFITQRFETWTPKFKEMPVTFARRCVFIGSTNEEQFLADKTGERRWLPVTVAECRPDLIERDRLQLWAEGLARFRANGIEWHAAERLAEGEHEQYKAPDLWEEQIAGWLMCEGPDGARNDARPFTLGEVMAQALHLEAKNVKRADENRVGKILRGLGFAQQQARIDGVKARRWVKT